MKKLMSLSLLLLAFGGLTACSTAGKKPSSSTSATSSAATGRSSSSKSSASSATSAVAQSSVQPPASSNSTVITQSGVASVLGQARIALFQAGVDSSKISDEQLLKYWNDAKAKGIDFVAYVKEQLAAAK